MNKTIKKILQYYSGKTDYNFLPLVLFVKEKENLDLSKDYTEITLPALLDIKNFKIAERMRKYASYRPTR